MTKRALLLILTALFALLLALSTGAALFRLLFWVTALMALYGFVAALLAARTLRVACALDRDRVVRGEGVQLTIRMRHACPLPVDDIELSVSIAGNGEATALYVPVRPFFQNECQQSIPCRHVGEFPAGVESARVWDVFGLFSFRRRIDTGGGTLIVRPQIHPSEPLAFSPGDSEQESASRAFEDATLPTDLRAYQQGDELKKVHWKLSMRRMELLVRVYEQPMRPDALLLVDCAPPLSPPGLELFVRDAICEAAASVAASALSEGTPVRMPLLTATPVDISASKAEETAMLTDALARCAFDGAQQFERVLLLETRRMRRTGTTAIVTSRINPVIADMILRIRRMGPRVRLLLAADIDEESVASIVQRLMRNDVEVVQVTIT